MAAIAKHREAHRLRGSGKPSHRHLGVSWHTRLDHVPDNILSMDLREIGRPWLQAAVRALHPTCGPISIDSPTAVQIQRIGDASKPSRRDDEETKRGGWDAAPAASSLIQLQLTDGVASVSAVVVDPIPGISGATGPGCKLSLLPGVGHVNGILCLTAHNVKYLGGGCERLSAESSLMDRTSTGRLAGHTGAPPFVPFGEAVSAHTTATSAAAAAAASSASGETARGKIKRDVAVAAAPSSSLPSFEVAGFTSTGTAAAASSSSSLKPSTPVSGPRQCTIVGMELITGSIRAAPQLLVTLRCEGTTLPAACTDKLASALLRLPAGTTITSLLRDQPKRRAQLDKVVKSLSTAMADKQCSATIDTTVKPFALLRAIG